jgi:MSHA biogenesis protein MshP
MALPVAIFIMVILSMMGAALVQLTQSSLNKTNMDLLNIKAYYSAKVGLEYGMYLANKSATCSATPQTINFSTPYLSGFKATFACVSTSAVESGTTVIFNTISSYGCNTSGASCPSASVNPGYEYSERLISGTITN